MALPLRRLQIGIHAWTFPVLAPFRVVAKEMINDKILHIIRGGEGKNAMMGNGFCHCCSWAPVACDFGRAVVQLPFWRVSRSRRFEHDREEEAFFPVRTGANRAWEASR